jgi:hypothetical protein
MLLPKILLTNVKIKRKNCISSNNGKKTKVKKNIKEVQFVLLNRIYPQLYHYSR